MMLMSFIYTLCTYYSILLLRNNIDLTGVMHLSEDKTREVKKKCMTLEVESNFFIVDTRILRNV